MIFSSLYGTRLTRELGTDDTLRFTTARRKQAINDGMIEFANLTECCVRWATATITGGTSEYDLNSSTVIPGADFKTFGKEPVEFTYTDASSNVVILSGGDLVRRDIAWLNVYEPGWRLSTVASSVMQLPRYYYLRPDGSALMLGFTPMPSTGSSASASVRIPYLAQVAPISSDSAEPFTFNSSVRTDLRPYHQGLVHYGAYLLEKIRRDPEAGQRQLQLFMTYVSRYVQDMRIKGGRTIMQARSYFTFRGRSATPDWRNDPSIR